MPYNTGCRNLSDYELDILMRAKRIWGGKANNNAEHILSDDEFLLLKHLQIEAMEEVDRRIENLIAQLPKPFLLVILGDHGEEFGEEGLYGHGFPHKLVLEIPLLITHIV